MEPETPAIEELRKALGISTSIAVDVSGTGASPPSWSGINTIPYKPPVHNATIVQRPVDPYEKQRVITETLKRQGDEFRARKKRVARLKCVSEAFKESAILTIDAERVGLARAMLKASGLPEYQFDAILSEVAADYYSGNGAMRRVSYDYAQSHTTAYPARGYNLTDEVTY